MNNVLRHCIILENSKLPIESTIDPTATVTASSTSITLSSTELIVGGHIYYQDDSSGNVGTATTTTTIVGGVLNGDIVGDEERRISLTVESIISMFLTDDEKDDIDIIAIQKKQQQLRDEYSNLVRKQQERKKQQIQQQQQQKQNNNQHRKSNAPFVFLKNSMLQNQQHYSGPINSKIKTVQPKNSPVMNGGSNQNQKSSSKYQNNINPSSTTSTSTHSKKNMKNKKNYDDSDSLMNSFDFNENREFSLKVRGEALPSIYQLSSLDEIVHVNSKFTHPIYIYNPHNSTMKIFDIYTSGGPFYLSLPNSKVGDLSNHLWEIPPFTKIHFINLYFISTISGLFNGFVNIETSYENFIIQADIQSVDEGVYLIPNEIDFGFLTSKTDFRSVSLFILNAQKSNQIEILDLFPQQSNDSFIKHSLHDTIIPPTGEKIEIAHFFFNGNVKGKFSGKYILKIKDHKDIIIPYKATVLYGDLENDPKDTQFFIDLNGSTKQKIEKSIVLTNRFPVPVTIQSLILNDEAYTIKNGSIIGKTVFPTKQWDPFTISFQQPLHLIKDKNFVSRHSSLIVHTNITSLELDLHSFNGKLEFTSNILDFENDKYKLIDFGVVGINEIRKKSIRFRNPNPFPMEINCISISKFDSNTFISIYLDAVYNEKLEFKASGEDIYGMEKDIFKMDCINNKAILTIEPGYSASFSVVFNSSTKGSRSSEIKVTTQIEMQSIPIKFKVLPGSLSISPQSIDFGSSTRNIIVKPIFAKSTYSIPVNITSIDSSDPRVKCSIITNTLTPFKDTHFANLIFDPTELSTITNDHSMIITLVDNTMKTTSLQSADNGGSSIATTITGSTNTFSPAQSNGLILDIEEFLKREEFWINKDTDYSVPSTVIIHTDLSADFTIKTKGVIIRPTLKIKNVDENGQVLVDSQETTDETVETTTPSESDRYFKDNVIDFKMVKIGQESTQSISIYNPLSEDIVAQLQPLETEKHIAKLLKENKSSWKSLNPIFSLQEELSRQSINNFRIDDLALSTPLTIPAHQSATFGPIKFAPTNVSQFTWILYIKNNFTVLHPIKLTGLGGGGRLVINLDGPSDYSTETNSILLELNKTHLSPCIFKQREELDINSEILIDSKNQKRKKNLSTPSKDKIEINKTIHIVNKGNLPILIHDVSINDLKCTGFGFKIQNCHQIQDISLSPGDFVKLTVSFEPDFSTSFIKKDLIFRTNQESISFPLVGSLPHDYLPLCTHLHPSFFYEYPAKIVFIICMIILFFVLIFISWREYSKPHHHHHQHYVSKSIFKSTSLSSSSQNSSNLDFSNRESDMIDYDFTSHQNSTTPKSPDKSSNNFDQQQQQQNIKSKKKKLISSTPKTNNNTSLLTQPSQQPIKPPQDIHIQPQRQLEVQQPQKQPQIQSQPQHQPTSPQPQTQSPQPQTPSPQPQTQSSPQPQTQSQTQSSSPQPQIQPHHQPQIQSQSQIQPQQPPIQSQPQHQNHSPIQTQSRTTKSTETQAPPKLYKEIIEISKPKQQQQSNETTTSPTTILENHKKELLENLTVGSSDHQSHQQQQSKSNIFNNNHTKPIVYKKKPIQGGNDEKLDPTKIPPPPSSSNQHTINGSGATPDEKSLENSIKAKTVYSNAQKFENSNNITYKKKAPYNSEQQQSTVSSNNSTTTTNAASNGSNSHYNHHYHQYQNSKNRDYKTNRKTDKLPKKIYIPKVPTANSTTTTTSSNQQQSSSSPASPTTPSPLSPSPSTSPSPIQQPQQQTNLSFLNMSPSSLLIQPPNLISDHQNHQKLNNLYSPFQSPFLSSQSQPLEPSTTTTSNWMSNLGSKNSTFGVIGSGKAHSSSLSTVVGSGGNKSSPNSPPQQDSSPNLFRDIPDEQFLMMGIPPIGTHHLYHNISDSLEPPQPQFFNNFYPYQSITSTQPPKPNQTSTTSSSPASTATLPSTSTSSNLLSYDLFNNHHSIFNQSPQSPFSTTFGIPPQPSSPNNNKNGHNQ
eukprot:gene4817-6004_t